MWNSLYDFRRRSIVTCAWFAEHAVLQRILAGHVFPPGSCGWPEMFFDSEHPADLES
jgi:hypothetical protein